MPSSTLPIHGLQYHVLHWGQPSQDCPILLVHGLGSTARVWELLAPLLVQGGHQVFAPDLRGHGQSDRPESGYDFRTMRQDLAALAEELKIVRPLVVGHSWGAFVALEYAAQVTQVERLPCGIVLIDGGLVQFNEFPGATWEAVRDGMAPPRWEGMRVEEFVSHLRDPSRAWQPDDQALDIILANFDISGQGTISPRLPYARYMQVVRLIWEYPTYERYEQVRCPVLMLPIRPRQTARMREHQYVFLKERGIERGRESIGSLDVQWLEDTVHDIPLDDPQALADRILPFAHSFSP